MASKGLKDNEVLIGENTYEIVPIKMKYMKGKFYTHHMLIKKLGLIKLMTYTDGEGIIIEYLTAAFDSEEKAKECINDINAKTLSSIRQKVKEINEIEEEIESPNVETPRE